MKCDATLLIVKFSTLPRRIHFEKKDVKLRRAIEQANIWRHKMAENLLLRADNNEIHTKPIQWHTLSRQFNVLPHAEGFCSR